MKWVVQEARRLDLFPVAYRIATPGISAIHIEGNGQTRKAQFVLYRLSLSITSYPSRALR